MLPSFLGPSIVDQPRGGIRLGIGLLQKCEPRRAPHLGNDVRHHLVGRKSQLVIKPVLNSYPAVLSSETLIRALLFGDMKTAGMIGGLGPESTIDYYRAIISRYRARNPDGGYPSLIINSLDVSKGINLVDTARLSELEDYLVAGVERLARAGAAFGFFSANTPHIVFDEVQRRSAIPLLSIVRATCDRAKSLGLKKVGLFGTRFTMQASFYPAEFRRAEITVVQPQQSEQDFIHEKYLNELLNGTFLPETRAELLRIADRMKVEEGTEAVILAGTELPLLLRGSENGIEFLDTAEIHVEAIIDELLR